jgi:hypothetical protein
MMRRARVEGVARLGRHLRGRHRHRVLLGVGQHAGERAGQDGFFIMSCGGLFGDVDFDQQGARRRWSPAWACTGLHRCRRRCGVQPHFHLHGLHADQRLAGSDRVAHGHRTWRTPCPPPGCALRGSWAGSRCGKGERLRETCTLARQCRGATPLVHAGTRRLTPHAALAPAQARPPSQASKMRTSWRPPSCDLHQAGTVGLHAQGALFAVFPLHQRGCRRRPRCWRARLGRPSQRKRGGRQAPGHCSRGSPACCHWSISVVCMRAFAEGRVVQQVAQESGRCGADPAAARRPAPLASGGGWRRRGRGRGR